jgi:hypothetical protein
VGNRWSSYEVTAVHRPIRFATEPSLTNELQPHRLAAALDPQIPIRKIAAERAAKHPNPRQRR